VSLNLQLKHVSLSSFHGLIRAGVPGDKGDKGDKGATGNKGADGMKGNVNIWLC
jgi:hypothetical protein